MNIVLLSGGSGKRLWPLSNDIRSKQFIKIFKCADGDYESMLQRVYRQIRTVDAVAPITVATSKTQVSAICNQLGDNVSISVEPCRRDTFPAIVLAICYLHDVLKISAEEAVVICPVDPYVENEYFAALQELSKLAEQEETRLVLLGITPTYPSEKYGYILPETDADVSKVNTFKEKPDAQAAAEYISNGALWNGGVFACKLKYVLQKAHELLDFTDYYDLYAKYETLEKISFDYAVVEQENLVSIARLAKQYPIHVRFIEMMPIGYGKDFQFRGESEICEILEKAYGRMTPIKERYGNGPCHYYKIEEFQGKIGFISAMTHKFCDQCNRVRMTAEGFLKACLQYQTGTDLKNLMRSGCTDDELTEAIQKVIWEKPVSHHFTSEEIETDECKLMSQIGG